MNHKSKIEDMLLEMIQPKLTEIGERFSRGEGLNGEDINTLLLKSQFNHINHLDLRLDEVVANVASLKTDFKQLENKFEVLETKFDALESRLDAKIDSLIAQFNEFKMELRLEIQMAIHKSMKWSIGLLAFIITFLKALEMLLAK
jgi:predicted nuclease with TOPRIM domain